MPTGFATDDLELLRTATTCIVAHRARRSPRRAGPRAAVPAAGHAVAAGDLHQMSPDLKADVEAMFRAALAAP